MPILSPSLLPPPSVPAARGRNRSRSGAASPSEPEENVLTAKQPTFQFPPRSATPRTARKPSAVDACHDDDDTIPLRDGQPSFGSGIPSDKHPPLGPGIPRDQHPPLGAGIPRQPPPPLGVGIPRHPPLGPGIPSRRSPSRMSSRSSSPQPSPSLTEPLYQEIEVPTFPGRTTQQDTPPPIVFSASSPTAPSPRQTLNRQRSKSSAVDSPGGVLKNMSDWNFPSQTPSPSTFQFPPPGFSQPDTPPLSAPASRTHNRVSPTHASASTISTVSRTSHQFTHSLDASAIPRRYQPPVSLPTPPPVGRSRSAAPFGDPPTPGLPTSNGPEAVVQQSIPKKPSMTRLASLPVMETVNAPTRFFARPERSGSLDTGPPVPGLKDVLKVIQVVVIRIRLIADSRQLLDSFADV